MQLTATDFQLFTSDEELDKAMSSTKKLQEEDDEIECEADFEATLMSFHNVRSVKRGGGATKVINRLHPETIESQILPPSQLQQVSCFNSAGKSSLKKQNNSVGSGTKKAVSYLSDFYSLFPVVNQ